MRTPRKRLRLSCLLVGITFTVLMFSAAPSALPVSTQETTPPNFKIAFVGDQYLGSNPAGPAGYPLPNQLGTGNDVWVSVNLRGVVSNKALISFRWS